MDADDRLHVRHLAAVHIGDPGNPLQRLREVVREIAVADRMSHRHHPDREQFVGRSQRTYPLRMGWDARHPGRVAYHAEALALLQDLDRPRAGPGRGFARGSTWPADALAIDVADRPEACQQQEGEGDGRSQRIPSARERYPAHQALRTSSTGSASPRFRPRPSTPRWSSPWCDACRSSRPGGCRCSGRRWLAWRCAARPWRSDTRSHP